MIKTETHAHAAGPRARSSRVPGLTTQIFIGLLLGIAVGYLWPTFGVAIKPLADAFLRMIKMIIAPLLFSTLVVGIAGTGDLKAMGRIGLKAIVYFEVATTIALFLGLFLVNVFKPGAGLAMPIGADRRGNRREDADRREHHHVAGELEHRLRRRVEHLEQRARLRAERRDRDPEERRKDDELEDVATRHGVDH